MEENKIQPEKQKCFLCLNIILVAPGLKSSNNNPNKSENDLFLRQFCQHLKINCAEKVSGESVNSTKILFCYKCQQLCFKFNKVFKFYELAQLRLQNVMEQISKEMKKEFVENLEPVDTMDILRKLVIEKTQAKLSNFRSPLVKIQRLAQDEISFLASTWTSKTEIVHDHGFVEADLKVENLQSAGLGVVLKSEVELDADVDLEVPHRNLEPADLHILEEGEVFKWKATEKKEKFVGAEHQEASTSSSQPRIRKGPPFQVPTKDTFQITSGGKFKCCQCSKNFRSKIWWQSHFESIHQQIRHKCPKCSTNFNASKTLNIHLMNCEESKQHHCPKCETTFSRRFALRRHFQEKHAADVKKWNCEWCDYKSTRRSNVLLHQQRVHAELMPPREVDVQGEKEGSRNEQGEEEEGDESRKAVDAAPKMSFVCTLAGCGREFSSRGTLNRHYNKRVCLDAKYNRKPSKSNISIRIG